jgi:hypothetical protein
MGYPVQVATTTQAIVFGPLVSSTDHLTPVSNITPTVTISKAGGTFNAPIGAVSEVGGAGNGNGWYKIAGNALDNGTAGPLIVHATGTGADPFDDMFAVVSYNPLSATNLGLSGLPTANPGANGGLPTADASNGVKVSVGTGAGQVNAASGKVPATLVNTDVTGNVAVDLQTIKTQTVTCAAGVTVLANVGTAAVSTAQTGDAFARLGAAGAGLTAIGDTRMANLDAAVSSRSTYAGGAVASVTAGVTLAAVTHTGAVLPRVTLTDTVTTYTGNTPQTGDAYARIGANGAGLTAVGPVTAVTGAVGSVTAGVTVTTNNDKTGYTASTVSDKTGYSLTTGERDSIATAAFDLANGVETGLTKRQALRAMMSVLTGLTTETSGTLVIKRKDGTTTAWTLVHDGSGNRTTSTVGTL